jgi:hypothetical protein
MSDEKFELLFHARQKLGRERSVPQVLQVVDAPLDDDELEAFDFEEAEDAPLDDDEEEDALVDDVEVVLTGLEETLSAPGGVRPPVRPTGTITVGW